MPANPYRSYLVYDMENSEMVVFEHCMLREVAIFLGVTPQTVDSYMQYMRKGLFRNYLLGRYHIGKVDLDIRYPIEKETKYKGGTWKYTKKKEN